MFLYLPWQNVKLLSYVALVVSVKLKLPYFLELFLMPGISYHLKGVVSKTVSFSMSAVVQMGKHIYSKTLKEKCPDRGILTEIDGE